MQDDLYPNDGTYFGVPAEPEDQVIARKKEKAKTAEALPLIKSIIQHFEDRIAFRDSIGSIIVNIEDDPSLHQKMMKVNQLLKQELEIEKIKLEELLEVHVKNL